jgi:hypothetical protein
MQAKLPFTDLKVADGVAVDTADNVYVTDYFTTGCRNHRRGKLHRQAWAPRQLVPRQGARGIGPTWRRKLENYISSMVFIIQRARHQPRLTSVPIA